MAANSGVRWFLTAYDKDAMPPVQAATFPSYDDAKQSWREAITDFPTATIKMYELTSVGEIRLLYDNVLPILDA
jgi:hypothetical protein